MRISKMALPVALCAGAIAGGLAPGHADAATARGHYISATAVCSGPLPVYDNQLKRRPLGILNQGTTSVFISCSVPSEYDGDITSADNFIRIYFRSFGAGGNIACTLNAGNRVDGSGSVALTTPIAAGGDSDIYFGSINKVNPWGSYNFSCSVPADVEMNQIYFGDGDTGDGL
jgi:hypothetical protein